MKEAENLFTVKKLLVHLVHAPHPQHFNILEMRNQILMIPGPTASGSLAAERRRDGHFPRLAAQAKDQGLQVT